MQRVYDVLQRAIFLGDHPYLILNGILRNKELQAKIIDLNTRGQLFDKGIDSKGRSLADIGGFYSPVTMQMSREKGRPKKSDVHVDLHDTGLFYESFYITIGEDAFYINADTGLYDEDLQDRWGKDIIGLTDESREKLIEWIKDEMVPQALEFLLAA